MTGDRILITGATGFVGRRLTARLAQAGHPLTLAVRRAWPDVPIGARIASIGDIGPETDWTEALSDVGVVIHLAAHVHVAPERALSETALFDRVNHLGAVHLYRRFAEIGGRLFVFLSSITVLGGASPAGHSLDDESISRPETPYARSKLAGEEALRALDGPTLVTLRPPLIAGTGVGGNLRSLVCLAALPVPLPFGSARNRRTLLSLDNLCSAIEAVIAAPRAGTYVLGDASALSTGEIVAAIRGGMGRSPGLLPVPVGLMGAAASLVGFGGHAQRLLGNLEVDSSRFRERFGWRDEISTRQALEEIGRSATR